MVIHTFVCDACNESLTDTTSKGIHYCPKCKEPMRWKMDGFMSGGGNFYHESKSMGCTENQIADLRKRFPGSEYKKKGKGYVLVTRSAREMDKRLKERGMVKFTNKDMVNDGNI